MKKLTKLRIGGTIFSLALILPSFLNILMGKYHYKNINGAPVSSLFFLLIGIGLFYVFVVRVEKLIEVKKEENPQYLIRERKRIKKTRKPNKKKFGLAKKNKKG